MIHLSPRSGLLALALLVPILAACASSPGGLGKEAPSPAEGTARASGDAAVIPASQNRELTVVELVRRAEPSVVRISTSSGVGTGVIIEASGEIVTNDHVISDAFGRPSQRVEVLLSDGTALQASIVGRDPRSDVAVLKVPGGDFTPLPLGSLSDVRVGEDVVAIGFALDLSRGEGPSFSVTRGIVSAKNRGIQESATILGAIQTDAAINPGNSGGPLLNLKGEVIGINTAIAPDRVTGGVAMGIGFAVGADTIKAVYEEIMAHGAVNRGLLGIRDFEALRPAQARALGLPEDTGGVFLDAPGDIAAGLPAAEAGLRPGDVIVSIGGYPVATESDLAVALIYNHAGETVPVEVYRRGELITLAVTLATPGN